MFAAFHLTDLPVTAALLEQPEWRDSPCAILRETKERDDGKIPLLALNSSARHTGISAGWPLGRALVPAAMVVPGSVPAPQCGCSGRTDKG